MKFFVKAILFIVTTGFLFVMYSGYDKSGNEPEYNIQAGEDPHKIQAIEFAFKEFLKACPTARNYWPDIIAARANVYDTYNSTAEEAGWPIQVNFQFVVTKGITRKIPRQAFASGHTLHFIVGAGNRPGIIIQKDQSAEFCGIASNNGNFDNFIDWPALKDLKL